MTTAPTALDALPPIAYSGGSTRLVQGKAFDPPQEFRAPFHFMSLEADCNRKRRELFDAQDAIDAQRDELIKRIEKQLSQHHTLKPVFAFRWRLA